MSNIIDKIQVSGVTYTLSAQTTGGTFDLPIYSGTSTNALKLNDSGNTASGDYSVAEGIFTNASGAYSHAEGGSTSAMSISSHAEGGASLASGAYSHAEGFRTSATTYYAHTEGLLTIANNESEHASGQFNVSSSASIAFGHSGNTLFSVGNGASPSSRHNAFEIRQNGDIYLSSGGTDIKLQDHLGGGGTVDQTIISGSTNAVAGGAVYNKIDEVEEVTAAGLNALNDKITPTVELTQAEYDALVTAGTVSADTYYIITDAQAGDLTQYWTSAQTQSAINQATSGKQETLVSGTNIKTINNESILGSGNIDIQGGGKAIEAGRGITVTTGETADTVSFNLPISAGTGTNSLAFGYNDASLPQYIPKATGRYSIAGGSGCSATTPTSVALGYSNKASGGAGANGNFAQGYMTLASGNRCHSEGLTTSATSDASHSEGYNTVASGNYSHSEGEEVKATNVAEHSQGRYNVSNNANTTWGDSGNTLFSVGNGTSSSARHNAFEIRQNGDIYLSSGGTDIKLQDHLGGSSITVDTALDSGSTNPVENRVIYNKIDEVEQVTAAALNNINDRLSEDEEVTAAGLNAVNDALGGLKLVKLTQAEYNALATKDSSTLYIIVN